MGAKEPVIVASIIERLEDVANGFTVDYYYYITLSTMVTSKIQLLVLRLQLPCEALSEAHVLRAEPHSPGVLLHKQPLQSVVMNGDFGGVINVAAS